MTLEPGSKLGPYEIREAAGAGGMGEVYRAYDSRLDRDVAIKVLPAHLSSNPELRQRFEREARAVSGLNHPHICVLHDIGCDEGTDYLVMEFLEGETLADRLARGALTPEETLRFGAQIADALDKAHRSGVVHRDLKPGNVMLTKSGAKLMDFGLARAASTVGGPVRDSSQSPTRTTPLSQPLTAEGAIVGTFQYMSPEQLEGKDSDTRSDIFALGTVLYEMATGHKAFEGASQASLIGAIMKGEPRPFAESAPLSPPGLERLVKHCLAKDPEDRLQSAHDVKLQLQWIAEGGSQAGVPAPVSAKRSRREQVAWAAAALLGIAAVALAFAVLRGMSRAPAVLHASIPPPAEARFQFSGDYAGAPVLSPDGRHLAFVAISVDDAMPRVWVRSLSEAKARPLDGTEGASHPFWSYDGRAIAFSADHHLKRVDLDGGAPLEICAFNALSSSRGGSWSRDGTILLTRGWSSDILRVPASGGTPQPVTARDTSIHTTHRYPQFMPDGEHFIYLAANHGRLDDELNGVWFGSLKGGNGHQVLHTESNALYASGHLFYTQGGTLILQKFDPKTGQLEGEPQPTSEAVQVDPSTWKTVLTLSEAGVLAYETGGKSTGSQLLWFDRSGRQVGSNGEKAAHRTLRISPDGRRLAVETQETPRSDIWVYDIARDTRTRLTFDPNDDAGNLAWSPDGRRLMFSSLRGGREQRYDVFEKRTFGGGDARLVLKTEDGNFCLDWSRDGRHALVSNGSNIASHVDLMVMPYEPKSPPYLLVENIERLFAATFSPDGRWVAYQGDEGDGSEVYIVPFAGPSADGRAPDVPRWQVSTHGGSFPKWRADGRELFYVRSDQMLMAVEIDGASDFKIGRQTELFRLRIRNVVESYDVTADGQRFVVSSVGDEGNQPLTLMINWREALLPE